MATVYLATDIRHERKVAVKVLRPDLSASIGAERFLQEIRIAARLSHPHILPLHDSGEAGGLLYYVMPYVSGESLRQRIAREGELPVADAARILRDVTDALAHAHEHGVVHRDIKPENILLTGRHALVADFGVAKALTEATGRNRMTSVGVALGTPAYMAPEQAVADPHVDHRADIYAIGVVGYEMIAGEPPFIGGTPQQVLASQVTETPRPVTTRRPAVSAALAGAIMRCLEKKPADRWQSASELLTQIESVQTTTTGGSTPSDTRPIEAARGGRHWPLITSGVAALALIVAAGLWFSKSSRADTGPAVTLRDRTQLTFTGRIQSPAISLDGKQVAYVTQECGDAGCTQAVDVQDVGGTTTRRVLAGTASVYHIEWSPDRRNLLVTGTINGSWGTHLVSLLGGAPRRVGLGGAMGGGGVTFIAGGDSLLVTPRISVDSLQWIAIASLDGAARDSIPVRTQGTRIGGVAAVPGTRWIEVDLIQPPGASRMILDRTGREMSRRNFAGGQVRASSNALWFSVGVGNGDRYLLMRAPFDSAAGLIGSRADTVYAGRFTGFSVSADGATVAIDDGTYQHNVYALQLTDLLAGRFTDERRIVKSSTHLRAYASPDGKQIVLSQEIPGAGGTVDYRWSILPFNGGTGTPLPVPPGTRSLEWFDTTTVAVARKDGSLQKLALVDVRTGAQRQEFTLPDSAWWDWTSLPDGGWAWIPNGTEIRVHLGGKTRSFPKPSWYEVFSGMSAAGGRLFVRGWNASTVDTMGVAELSLRDGTVTRWYSQFVDDARIGALGDGTGLFYANETAENVTLVHLLGPGSSRRLGTVPRPVRTISVSNDLKRAVVVTRDYFGDVWLHRVVPATSR